MAILVTGFNGKVGFEVAQKLKERGESIKCAVRNVDSAIARYGDEYPFTQLDFAKPETFAHSLEGIDKVFLMYPPGDAIQFETFIETASQRGIQHIVYLSLKDVQFMPFIHHYKNEKLVKKYKVPYTFLRAGYFMQNLNDFLKGEIVARKRIFVPAGMGKTSFIDARDIAEMAAISLGDTEKHRGKSYVLTGNEALDFGEVAEIMTDVLGVEVLYSNPTVKEFREFMISNGADKDFINLVVGIHFPTKLGLAKGITYDFEKAAGRKPGSIRQYILDFRQSWL